ncbi:MAG: AbrB/MazE/SpoVT family DNA-binding domain-containing protein [bacterium]
MKITSKGQVTIPLALRKELGWNRNTEVAPHKTRDGVLFRPQVGARTRGEKLVQRLAGQAQTSWTTDKLMALTRG